MYEPVVRILIVDDEKRSGRCWLHFWRVSDTKPPPLQTLMKPCSHCENMSLTWFFPTFGCLVSAVGLLSHIKSGDFPAGVVLLTGCDDVGMAVSAMKLGALDDILKPFQLEDVGSSIRKALDARREVRERKTASSIWKRPFNARRSNCGARWNICRGMEITLDALVAALDAREHETQAHSKRVSEYTIYLARALGVDPALLDVIRRGAMLHDIGKIGILRHYTVQTLCA